MNKLNCDLKILLILSMLIFAGCKADFDAKFSSQNFSSLSDGNNVVTNAAGIDSYRTNFYAYTQTRGCVKCHGNSVSPLFASPNINVAYASASGFDNSNRKLINFNDPKSSIIIEYAGNNHCNDIPCSDPAIRPTVQGLLETWAAVEVSLTNGVDTPAVELPKFITGTLQVPAVIPTVLVVRPGLLRFPLSALKPAVPGLENAIFEIEIAMANDFQYRLQKPKLAGNTRAFDISKIQVFIKEINDPANLGKEDVSIPINWRAVAMTAPIVVLPATLPVNPLTATSLSDLPIYFQTNTKMDYFTIGFGDIK